VLPVQQSCPEPPQGAVTQVLDEHSNPLLHVVPDAQHAWSSAPQGGAVQISPPFVLSQLSPVLQTPPSQQLFPVFPHGPQVPTQTRPLLHEEFPQQSSLGPPQDLQEPVSQCMPDPHGW